MHACAIFFGFQPLPPGEGSFQSGIKLMVERKPLPPSFLMGEGRGGGEGFQVFISPSPNPSRQGRGVFSQALN